jgi:hypothetical protein
MPQIIEVPGKGQVEFPDGMSDADIAKVIRNDMMQKNVPANSQVALNASSKVIASIPDSLLNAPQNIMNLGRAAYGTAATAMGRPDLAPELTPNPNYAHKALTAINAIRPEAEPVTRGQRILDTAIQGGVGMALNPASSGKQLVSNVMTGLASGAVGGSTREATGSDAAGMATTLATPLATNAVANIGRMSGISNPVRDKTLDMAKKEGYKLPPSEFNASFLNNRLESFAGKAAIKQDAALRNQEVTNNIAARELGLPKGTAITESVLERYRNAQAQPYREVAALSPIADRALERLRQTRAEAKMQWNHYNRTATPDAYKQAQAMDQQAKTLENAIDRIASKSGDPELLNRLKEARTNIAKSYDIEKALNLGDANISASVIGRALDRGAPLSGGLETIARFQQGPGRKFTSEGSSVPAPGVSALDLYGMGLLGGAGALAAGHPIGAAAGLLPLARGPVRNLLLSDAYQNRLFSPRTVPVSSLFAASPQAQDSLRGLLSKD